MTTAGQTALPWMLSGGLSPDNVAQALAMTGAAGLDVSSGVESAPGIKSVEKIGQFITREPVLVDLQMPEVKIIGLKSPKKP